MAEFHFSTPYYIEGSVADALRRIVAPGPAEHYTHLATRKRGLLNLKWSRFEAQSQRDCASKPSNGVNFATNIL